MSILHLTIGLLLHHWFIIGLTLQHWFTIGHIFHPLAWYSLVHCIGISHWLVLLIGNSHWLLTLDLIGLKPSIEQRWY